MSNRTMYCTECEAWVPCAVPLNSSSDEHTTEPRPKCHRRQSKDYSDLRWFVRSKTCENGHDSITCEIEARFVDELIRLRGLVERLAPTLDILARESKKLVKKSNTHGRNNQLSKER